MFSPFSTILSTFFPPLMQDAQWKWNSDGVTFPHSTHFLIIGRHKARRRQRVIYGLPPCY